MVSRLLAAERRRRGTRGRRRALGCYRQTALVLRWFLDGTRLTHPAADHRIGRSTAYRICSRASTSSPWQRGVSLWVRSSELSLVEGAVAEHREQDVDPAAGQADEGGVVAFAGGAFAVVVSP